MSIAVNEIDPAKPPLRPPNAFGMPDYDIKPILQATRVVDLVRDVLLFEAKMAGSNADHNAVNAFLNIARSVEPPEAANDALRQAADALLGAAPGRQQIQDLRVADILAVLEAHIISSDLKPRGRLLDLGCGHGRIAAALSRRLDLNVVLADVVDYRAQETRQMPFVEIREGAPLPFRDGEFDDVLLITVLHHAEDPVKLLAEAARVSTGRLYLMESLVGVEPGDRTVHLDFDPDSFAYLRLEERFARLSLREQLMHAYFQDWFYNSVVQGGVPVPNNLGTDQHWRQVFDRLGLQLLVHQMLGFDQRTAPEYHALYVVEHVGAYCRTGPALCTSKSS